MNNRQAGRRRGRGGQRQGGNPGRPDNGNRIDNRARGNAAQLLEKYKNLATDAQRSGDRVTTEYYLQFADHYFRVLAESRSRTEDGQQRRSQGDEEEAEGVEDFGFEGDLGSPAFYQQPQQSQPQQDDREDRSRRDRDGQDGAARTFNDTNGRDAGERDGRPRQRDDQPREARPRREREGYARDNGARDAAPRETGFRDTANREAVGEDRPRRDRAASNDTGEERPRREPRSHGREAAYEARPETPGERPAAANDEPRRRGRPRREVAAVESEGFDAALLPPAIATEPAAASDVAEDAPAERPRRGRPRRVRTDDEVVPPPA